MKTQVMIDLESLGTKPGSALVALGAVKFGNGEILAEFYERIDVESCVQLGLEMDTSTVMWWLKQADGPRLEITQPGKHLAEVLGNFSQWIGAEDVEVWGNGAAFDNVLLSCAYDAAIRKRPWKYSGDRCYRTIKNLHPEVPMVRDGTHHNALDDARDQARHLMAILSPTNDEMTSPH
jgi:DNA polymerase III epsilon subunit-like protein